MNKLWLHVEKRIQISIPIGSGSISIFKSIGLSGLAGQGDILRPQQSNMAAMNKRHLPTALVSCRFCISGILIALFLSPCFSIQVDISEGSGKEDLIEKTLEKDLPNTPPSDRNDDPFNEISAEPREYLNSDRGKDANDETQIEEGDRDRDDGEPYSKPPDDNNRDEEDLKRNSPGDPHDSTTSRPDDFDYNDSGAREDMMGNNRDSDSTEPPRKKKKFKLFEKRQLPHAKARAFCKKREGELAQAMDYDEMERIQILLRRGIKLTPGVWIGANTPEWKRMQEGDRYGRGPHRGRHRGGELDGYGGDPYGDNQLGDEMDGYGGDPQRGRHLGDEMDGYGGDPYRGRHLGDEMDGYGGDPYRGRHLGDKMGMSRGGTGSCPSMNVSTNSLGPDGCYNKYSFICEFPLGNNTGKPPIKLLGKKRKPKRDEMKKKR